MCVVAKERCVVVGDGWVIGGDDNIMIVNDLPLLLLYPLTVHTSN